MTPATNAFNLQGPSTVLNKLGRIKSAHQRQQDATRVNQYSDVARATDSDKTKVIVGRRNEARSQ